MTSAYFLLALREFGTTPESEAGLLEGVGDTDVASGEITLGQQLGGGRSVHRANAWSCGDRCPR